MPGEGGRDRSGPGHPWDVGLETGEVAERVHDGAADPRGARPDQDGPEEVAQEQGAPGGHPGALEDEAEDAGIGLLDTDDGAVGHEVDRRAEPDLDEETVEQTLGVADDCDANPGAARVVQRGDEAVRNEVPEVSLPVLRPDCIEER